LGANSTIRKVAKAVFYPLANDRTYKYIQALSKAWDIKTGSWSEPELELVGLGLRPGETTLDIGANYGLYSHYMSRAVGRDGKVYAFEPVPFTFDSLRVVAKILGFSHNVELVKKGCSNNNAKIKFTLAIQPSGAFAAGLTYVGGRNDDRVGKETQVRWNSTRDIEADVVRLDDFLPEITDLPFVKMDIEGAEYFCLQGAEKLFSKHLPTTICEINPWYLEGFGVRTEDVTGFFVERGYKIFFFSNEQGRQQLRQVSTSDIVEDNYLFLHPSRFERFAHILPAEIG
jgi:FkbM family methyltransferase